MMPDLGSPQDWTNLATELEGTKVLEKPRVSKKTMTKALRMQALAMKCMLEKFDQLSTDMLELQRDNKKMKSEMELLEERTAELEQHQAEAQARLDAVAKEVHSQALDIQHCQTFEPRIDTLESQAQNLERDFRIECASTSEYKLTVRRMIDVGYDMD